jgi:hypothetical protein
MSNQQADKLNILQDLLIDEFITRINSGEASPSDLNAARQMLKDNGIHASIKEANPLADLIALLPFKDEMENVSKAHV